MNPQTFKEIREHLGLTQLELSEVFGFTGFMAVSHYETGFRQPNPLIVALMKTLESLPEKRAVELMELLKSHMEKKAAPKKKKTHAR